MKNNLLKEYISLLIEENESSDTTLNTFGELKKALKVYIDEKGNKQKISKRKDMGKSAAKFAIDFIPYAGAAVNMAELLGKIMNTPDEKRPKGFLSTFDLDDYTSRIVDNDIEAEFLKYLVEKINSADDDKPLKGFNMTSELNNYLKQNYGGRFVKKQ